MFSKLNFFSNLQKCSSSTQKNTPHLLCLHGEKGTVACRVHDPLDSNLFPHRSPWGRLKYTLLSENKMGNLTAVRGRPGMGMVGPADYFCDLERSDQYLISIDISLNGVATFNQYPLNYQHDERPTPLVKLDPRYLTKVKAQWFSGADKERLRRKMKEYSNKNNPVFSESLFPNSGILELDGPKEISLKTFDPKRVDLSEFKARLVANDIPFQITSNRLRVDDEYCCVSYQYDAKYAERQVTQGGGLFLEFHQFAQTITPLHSDSTGFVTLGKWDETQTHLELIAVQIPYGCTLIIEKDCIHGDTNLNGLFMMCMTSDHITMATADTVFLKHAKDKDNINITLDNIPALEITQRLPRSSDPLVVYHENERDNLARFKQRTRNMQIIFNPHSRGYWEVKPEAVKTIACFMLAGACLPAAILLMNPMFLLGLGLFLVSAILVGVGLYRVLPSALSEQNHSLDDNALTTI